MKEFLKALNKTNEVIINKKVSSDIVDRFSHSDYLWADRIDKPFNNIKIRIGEVYQIEFGKNLIPEMSYEHRGLIIGVKNKLIYVLPIFTYDPGKISKVYHPVDNPNSKSDYYLLKKSEFSFINHDSVLKLNDIRTVSLKRVLYKHSGLIDPKGETYKGILNLTIQKYFSDFYREHINNIGLIGTLNSDITSLNEQIDQLKEVNKNLKIENENLKKEIEKIKMN